MDFLCPKSVNLNYNHMHCKPLCMAKMMKGCLISSWLELGWAMELEWQLELLLVMPDYKEVSKYIPWVAEEMGVGMQLCK